MVILRNISVVVCGIVRDAEKGLKRNIPVISQFLSLCGDYRAFIYENDSKDQSKKLLQEWHQTDPQRIHISINDHIISKYIPIKTLNNVNPFFSKERIEKMAMLRNKYMDYINEKGWTADYLMIVDLDVAHLFLDGIMSSFLTDRKWDAVTAFGYSTSPQLRRRYHDGYALTLWGDQGLAQKEESIIKNSYNLGNLKADDEWIRIFSGFGGLAIYRFETVKGLRYQVIDNDDPRVEVKCEHFSIYDQMIKNGYDRIYINPDMKLKYQDLNLKIILKSATKRIHRFISRYTNVVILNK